MDGSGGMYTVINIFHDTCRALIGAPKAQTSQPDVDEGGAVYKCPVEPLTNPGPCEQIPFDLTGK